MCAYYSFQYDCFFWGGISPAGGGIEIYISALYYSYSRLVWEARGNRCHTLIPPTSAASIVANHRGCRQWILQELAMLPWPPARWGEGLSILLAASSGGTPG